MLMSLAQITFQLTFSVNSLSGGRALLEGYYGPGDGPILLDQVECRGHEVDIAECEHPPWYEHDCSHSEDAAVECGEFRAVCLNTSWSILWQDLLGLSSYPLLVLEYN